jgi:putative endonuclease
MSYFYTYALQSEKDLQFYVGYTNNLLRRIDDYNKGKVVSTKNRLPLKLIYWEGCLNQKDVTKREKYLKTSWVKDILKTG